MANDQKREFSSDQIFAWFERSAEEDTRELKALPALFKKGEGIDEVPGGNDDALDDLAPRLPREE